MGGGHRRAWGGQRTARRGRGLLVSCLFPLPAPGCRPTGRIANRPLLAGSGGVGSGSAVAPGRLLHMARLLKMIFGFGGIAQNESVVCKQMIENLTLKVDSQLIMIPKLFIMAS